MKMFLLVALVIIAGLVLGFVLKTDVNPQVFDKTMEVTSVAPPSEFMWAGRPLSDPSLRDQEGRVISTARKYVEALTKFPDLRSCLKDPHLTSQTFDVLTFNWNNIRSIPEFNVCVFHVSNALHDIDRLVEWLDVSGFNVISSVSTQTSEKFVDMTWRIKTNQSNSPYPRSILLDWLERILGSGKFSATIQLDESNKVVSIRSGFNYK